MGEIIQQRWECAGDKTTKKKESKLRYNSGRVSQRLIQSPGLPTTSNTNSFVFVQLVCIL